MASCFRLARTWHAYWPQSCTDRVRTLRKKGHLSRRRSHLRGDLFQGCASEDSAQFEKHTAMPRRSNRPAKLNRSKYRIGHKCDDTIARRLCLKWRRKDPAHLKQAVEIESLAQQDRKLDYFTEIACLERVVLVGKQFIFTVSGKGVGPA